jgi:hypothetical protein
MSERLGKTAKTEGKSKGKGAYWRSLAESRTFVPEGASNGSQSIVDLQKSALNLICPLLEIPNH